jgi:hypothetical protein
LSSEISYNSKKKSGSNNPLNYQILNPSQGEDLIPSKDKDGFTFFPQGETFSALFCQIWKDRVV